MTAVRALIARFPLRLRVAMAFAVTAAITLTALGAFIYYRVQATLVAQAHTTLETQMEALAQLPRTSLSGATAQLTGETFAQVLTPNADPAASSPQVRGTLITPDQVPTGDGTDVHLDGQVRLVDEDETEDALLLLRRDGDQVLVVGTSREDLEDAQAGVLTQLLIGGPLALALASWLSYLVAGAALRPVESMRRHAATISAQSSGERLPIPATGDELQRLGLTLNQMLDRLEQALQRERRFFAEASHELRTPLALLQMELDLALARPRPADELRAALDSANEEVVRLTKLSEDLLQLADANEPRLVLNKSTVDIEHLLLTIADRFSATAANTDRKITVTGDFPLLLHADCNRLDQALTNLVDNALRHGSGDVDIRAESLIGQVRLVVADRGPGLPANLRERTFEPFAREASGPRSGRRGLGLSIVWAIVSAHGGAVTIDDRPDTPGTELTIQLPQRT